MKSMKSIEIPNSHQILLRLDSTNRQEMMDSNYLQPLDQLQRSMSSLQHQFQNILISHTTPILTHFTSTCTSFSESNDTDDSSERLQHESFDSCNLHEIDLIPSDTIHDLRSIAERMINSGHLHDCLHVYAAVRKTPIETTLNNLGVDNLTVGDIQRLDWETLNTKITKWVRAAKICIRVLFTTEKTLCSSIFQDLDTQSTDTCFIETVKSPATQLFNFADAISTTNRSPEKLFKILDLHDAVLDLLPDIETVFDSKGSESIRVQAKEIVIRLSEAARGMLSEFESAVLKEPSKVPVPGGTIHPLTRYVMNYISLISDYKQTLGELIVDKPVTGLTDSAPDMDFVDHEGRSALALHLIWIIVILQFNLEAKSKHYSYKDKDNSLAYVFMMNNIHYIVQKVKGSTELRELIGDNYLKRLTGKYRQAATRYQRATWVGVLYCLRDEGLHNMGSFSTGVSKSALRERFKSFNAAFDEVHRMQALWLVPDTQLREELQISISEKLIPAYRSFLGRFRTHIEQGRHPENYIKYSVEDLEAAVLDFFEGNAVSQHSRRRSQ